MPKLTKIFLLQEKLMLLHIFISVSSRFKLSLQRNQLILELFPTNSNPLKPLCFSSERGWRPHEDRIWTSQINSWLKSPLLSHTSLSPRAGARDQFVRLGFSITNRQQTLIRLFHLKILPQQVVATVECSATKSNKPLVALVYSHLLMLQKNERKEKKGPVLGGKCNKLGV